MVDFDKIQDFLDNLFKDDERAKDIINSTGLTSAQLKVINTLIVNALKAYDAEGHKK